MFREIFNRMKKKTQKDINAKLLRGLAIEERDPWKKQQEYVLAHVIAQKNGIRQ